MTNPDTKEGVEAWPKTCRCGFEASGPDEAEAHTIVEHPEVLDDD